MEKIFISPSKYIQGKNILETGLSHIKKLGTKALLITDDFVLQIVGEAFRERLTETGMIVTTETFNGEITEREIKRLIEKVNGKKLDVVLALGGGKVIDIGKAIAEELNIKVAVIPTTASTDAPTSSISVLYETDGRFKNYSFYDRNPELVFIDTAVIAQAPVRFLISGMADALATTIEARAVTQGFGKNVLGGMPTIAAKTLAEKCEEIIFTYGLQAIEANRNKVVTEALEAVVEANTLLSGIGFESVGLAAAHAIHNGFSAIEGNINQLTHGEKVAFGTLTQLIIENQPKEIVDKYIQFYRMLGLPTTLDELGLSSMIEEKLVEIARQALVKGDSMKQMPMKVKESDIVSAIKTLDGYVKTYFVQN